jgi:hypothetical protein
MSNTSSIVVGLLEDDLRVKVLIPLLRALGCIKVEDWQGTQENGKDIYFAYKDVLGDIQHCCVFIKVGDITKSGKTSIRNYESQLREAFNADFTNPLDNATSIRAGSVYVACNGFINDAARNYMHQNFELQFPGRIRFLDIDKICYLIDVELGNRIEIPAGYTFEISTFTEICEKSKAKPLAFLGGGFRGTI